MATNSTVTQPSVTIQNVVFTAKRFGQFPTITYANTAVAGSETVSVDSSLNITVGIQSGTTTMTQIKTAIDNSKTSDGSFAASDLVSVNVSSHGADTAVSCVAVPLAGGVTSDVKATLHIDGLLLTAVSAGTSGNSIRLKFTDGAASTPVVTVSTNDITVQLKTYSLSANTTSAPGTQTLVASTLGEVITAINGDVSASALVVASTNGKASTSPMQKSMLPAFTNLSGGLAAAPATLTIQGITVTSNTNDATQNGLTLTLTDGATAGAEVVSVDGSGNVTCQCQIGTSTVTQIVTALSAAGAFTALYTATGSGSTHPNSVYQKSMSGAVNGGGYGFYVDNNTTVLTSTFVYFPFLNTMQDLLIENRDPSGNNTVIFSFDGINNHGILSATQSRQVFKLNKPGIYIKYGTGAPAYRCSAI